MASCECSCSVPNATLRFQNLSANSNVNNNFVGRQAFYPHAASTTFRSLKIVCARRVSSRKRAERIQERDKVSVNSDDGLSMANSVNVKSSEDDFVVPKLPGEEPDFWEGPQWDTLGFIVQYLWALGIVFALIACGIAVRTYNFGATDFKETPLYKESVESQALFEETPEASDSQVFETNPTEEAPLPQ
eukprot:Gb_25599 [translate_table: standard]